VTPDLNPKDKIANLCAEMHFDVRSGCICSLNVKIDLKLLKDLRKIFACVSFIFYTALQKTDIFHGLCKNDKIKLHKKTYFSIDYFYLFLHTLYTKSVFLKQLREHIGYDLHATYFFEVYYNFKIS
jgi:hypothetical protein